MAYPYPNKSKEFMHAHPREVPIAITTLPKEQGKHNIEEQHQEVTKEIKAPF
jgi:hypothetical protein